MEEGYCVKKGLPLPGPGWVTAAELADRGGRSLTGYEILMGY